ncbi:type 4 pilus major pilin [Pantoea ananatis]|uniref:type 4 pilus major pilin n=1 Tax=Pantoea ananas TaxID=553 RepID=UPI0021E86FB3|nr:type 4 pilus major pilin [Pantoea ananatis]MCW0309928.1 hypothetical protein [Pantoea ananatis]MCW0341658.1 hypothetical protein [Pantoea ananatis]MCW0360090.1 hypothetical protein [Pantoea ananatis]MCW0364753.1 hypothetical protein [Pantoea ananatis]MCW1777338.1 conjugal transfer protein [Pantoea ananatis]
MKMFKKGIAYTVDITNSILVVIVIIAIGGTFSALAGYMINTTSEVTLLTTIKNETQNMKPSNGYGNEDYVPALVKSESIAKSYTIANGLIYNKSGGQVTVVGNGTGFIITDPKLPRRDCIKASKSFGTADLASTSINGTTFNGEVKATDAATACIDGDNTLVFTTKN